MDRQTMLTIFDVIMLAILVIGCVFYIKDDE